MCQRMHIPGVNSPPEPVPCGIAQCGARSPRVLVVDDNQTNRMVTSAVLGRAGFDVSVAVDGADAVAAVRDGGKPPDVVLMDLIMPTMDGIEATRQIRALPGALGQVTIIALTAQDLPEDRQRCMGAGMNDFLVKPARKAVLIGTLQRWLTASVA